MKRILLEILITVFVFLAVDSVWLMLIMKNHYAELVYKIQGSPLEANFIAAGFCYLFLVGGLYYLVIHKIKKFDLIEILSYSVPYGLATYGTFDFTTSTVLKDWDLLTAFADTAWGAFLCSVTAIAVVFARNKFLGGNEFQEVENNTRDS